MAYMFYVVIGLSAKYKAAWYEAARLRVGETELLRQASLKAGLGWPDERERPHSSSFPNISRLSLTSPILH